ncbi:ribonuclease H-like domain-containing protein [Mycena sp. CBHHK59/15]|nr:ribonuclease H-like domain-containing protein [Mycena sp. CBHHK59/15]
MLVEFGRLVKAATGRVWDPVEWRIGCLAHVINIVTQKLISAYSKSPHFNAHEPAAHIPDTSAEMCDEIGLERSSSKRKDLFKRIQVCHQTNPADVAKQMVLDMKVRWSSTYTMLDCGYNLKEDVYKFVFEIAMDETGEKRKKLAALQLTEAEWSRVDLFLNLLAFAEHSQHKFSSDLKSTLHVALPALEALHAGWTKCAADAKYSDFKDALEQALEKVDEYYQKTANSNTYMFAMGNYLGFARHKSPDTFAVLDPAKKLSYFEKHWPATLQGEAKADMEETFKQRYLQLRGSSAGKPQAGPAKKSNSTKMRCSIVIEEDDDSSVTAESHVDPLKPWCDEYELYFNMREVIPEGMDTIKWWGVYEDDSAGDQEGEMDGDVDENSWDGMLHEDPDNYDPDYDMES